MKMEYDKNGDAKLLSLPLKGDVRQSAKSN